MQGNLFPPDTNWRPPQEFPSLAGRIVAVDLETKDPKLMELGPGWAYERFLPASERGYIVGIAIAFDDVRYYYPIRHEGGGNLDAGMVARWLTEELPKAKELVFANALYDLGWLLADFGLALSKFDNVTDVQFQAPLLDEYRRSYSLENLGRDYLGQGKSTNLLKEACTAFGLKGSEGNNIWRLPASYVGPYAEADVDRTLGLRGIFTPLIKDQELERASALEHSLIPVLLDMRWRGVRVDLERAEDRRRALLDRARAIQGELKRETGVAVDPWVASSVAAALATVGVHCPTTPRSGEPSVTKAFLAELGVPLAGKIRELRMCRHTADTFLKNYIQGHAVHNSLTGEYRIFAEFHPLRTDDGGTVGGRFSSSNPSLQNLPAREEEISSIVRGCLLPDEYETWMSADYTAQEPRLSVHFAEIAKVRGGFEAAERYRNDPLTDYHQMVADLCGITRKSAKAINLGLGYGMGGAKLCRSLGLPTKWITAYDGKTMIEVAGDEGQEIINTFHQKAPFVKGLIDLCSQRASTRGFIRTLSGRKCRFPKDEWRAKLHKAVNRLVQGSAADQTKEAMRSAHAAGHKITVQVHDELCFSLPDAGKSDEVKYIMENCVKLTVPSIVTVKLGPAWGESFTS